MRRFLSIAIFSAVVVSSGWTQQITNRNGAPIFWVLDIGGNRLYMRSEVSGSIVLNGSREGPSPGGFTAIRSGPGNATIVQWNVAGLLPGRYTFTPTNYSANNTGNNVLPPVMRVQWTNNTLSVWEPDIDPLQTNSFNWTFGSEWSGVLVEVRSGTNSLFSGFVPSGGGSVFGTVITNGSLMSNAMVFLDGVSAAALATSSTNANLDNLADRPGYALTFGPDYQGGEWQVRRADGSVAATGSAGTLGAVSSGRVTVLPEGSSGSIWTRVPAGDGMGSTWVNSGITVSGNNVTTYNFVAAPQPTPLPTPSFATNAMAPTITNAPAPTIPGTNTTASAPVATNDVTVDVDQLQPIPTDDGEQAALDGVRNASEKLRGILDNFRGSFDNVALTFNEFRKFTLGGVGTTCTFTLGDVTINLSNIVPAWLRSGMKLAILIVAVFSMIRYTWETFR